MNTKDIILEILTGVMCVITSITIIALFYVMC